MKVVALASLAVALWCAADEEAELTWIFIHTGPRNADLPADEMTAATNGHFENMTRMTEAGHLLVAGPLGPPRADPAHRGIFVIDESDPERALEIASSDPAVQAGVFELEAIPWRTADPMERIVELDRADLTARAAASATGEAEWAGRAYVLASTVEGDAGEEALEPLVDEGLVLFRGRLGGERAGGLLACLNVTDAGEAEEMLSSVGEDVKWSLHGWYASNGLVHLPFLRAHPAGPTFHLREVEDQKLYARRVEVFGIAIMAQEGVPDRVTLRMAHLLAQYLDPDEDGEPDADDIPGMALFVTAGTTESLADRSVRKTLERAGLELPETTPDGGYRVD